MSEKSPTAIWYFDLVQSGLGTWPDYSLEVGIGPPEVPDAASSGFGGTSGVSIALIIDGLEEAVPVVFDRS
jgi:hypothetical protein